MREVEFEAKAVKQKDGNTCVWTDGLAISTDGERYGVYAFEDGKKYKIKLVIEEMESPQ